MTAMAVITHDTALEGAGLLSHAVAAKGKRNGMTTAFGALCPRNQRPTHQTATNAQRTGSERMKSPSQTERPPS